MKANMVQLPVSQVHFHPASFGDPNGRVFCWNGDLYRGVSREHESVVESLFQKSIVQTLVDKGLLIHTEVTDFALDSYGLVLKHRTVPFASYNYEWCADALKDAALLIVDLELELQRHGYTLKDAHPNVLFEGTRPVYVDFSSICPYDGHSSWQAYNQLCRFYVDPLRLMVLDHGRIARRLLHDTYKGVCRHELAPLFRGESLRAAVDDLARSLISVTKRGVPTSIRPKLRKGLASIKTAFAPAPTNEPRVNFLRNLRNDIAAIEIPLVQSHWSDYYDDCYPAFTPSQQWTAKHHSVYKVLSDLHPSSVLDIACNRGWYSQLAATLGSNVIAFDFDETSISQLYRDAKEKNLPILPLVMDFRVPSPAYGIGNMEGAPASERFNCDLVLALALIHHLVAKSRFNFEQITEGLSSFSKRWLLVEFIPHEDVVFHQPWSAKCLWYTLDNFVMALRKHFYSVNTYPSYPDKRVLLLCEK